MFIKKPKFFNVLVVISLFMTTLFIGCKFNGDDNHNGNPEVTATISYDGSSKEWIIDYKIDGFEK